MRRPDLGLLAGAAVVLLVTVPAGALSPPHDETNDVDCTSCHAPHGDELLPRDEAQQTVCLSCHNPTGPAASMSEVALHVVDDDATTVDCGSCHDPHAATSVTDPHAGGLTADNLLLLRDDVDSFVAGASTPLVYQSTPDHFAFAESEPPWVGSCQVCHTATNHHRNDAGADHDHQMGETCTMCHPHDEGFLPSGGCTDCHAVAQGARRQVVDAGGDFERASHHVQGTVDDDDCVACHYTGQHQDGTVVLKDPDDGAATLYEFDDADPAGIEDFCIACHDDDGALALDVPSQPFTDGQTPPDVWAGGLWDDAAHNTFGHGPNNDQPISCMGDGSTSGCHANGHGSDGDRLLAAAAGVTLDDFCFGCHTDGVVVNDALANNRPGEYVSADDIEQAFGMGTTHSLGTTFEIGGDTFTLQCTSCHNPHLASGGYWDTESGLSPTTRPDFGDVTGNPRGMGSTLWGDEAGEKMDDFAAQGAGSGGWYYSTARGDSIVVDQPAVYRPPKSGTGYEREYDGDVLPDYTSLCLDCHTYRMSADIPEVNWGQAGVTCTGNGVDPPNQRVECGAQHGLNAANKPYYISDTGTAGFWGTSGNPDVIFSMNYVTRGRHSGQFMRWPYDSAERQSGINFVMSCTDCHEAHGSPRGGMIRERFNVNSNGDCGTGGDVDPNGENCTDGGNWNSFCNACHYYYGGHHAGMSCGNASCHEANSIHRIIHNTSSGGTQLMVTASGYESYFEQPDFTPDIVSVVGDLGSDQLEVTFADGVYSESDLSGALDPEDFWLFDHDDNNPRSVTTVYHVEGEDTAWLVMDAALTEDDLFTDTLAMRPASAWAWYDGGYVNWANGTLSAQEVSAGPWPIEVEPTVGIDSAQGVAGYDQVLVTFSTGVYGDAAATAALEPADLVITDADDGRTVTAVDHEAGDGVALLTLSSALDADDVDVDEVAAADASSIFSVDGFTMSTLGTVIEGTECPIWGTTFEFDEAAGSATVSDTSGLLVGDVSDAAATLLGDGLFTGDGTDNYVELLDDDTCFRFGTSMTLEALVYSNEVDDGEETTIQRVWLKNGSNYQLSIWRNVSATWLPTFDPPTGVASFALWMKPEDPRDGYNWKVILTDYDACPIQAHHWYQVRVVWDTYLAGGVEDQLYVPGGIYVDDLGAAGDDVDEAWSGYADCTDSDQSQLPAERQLYTGDVMSSADSDMFIGTTGAYTKVLDGYIDWISLEY